MHRIEVGTGEYTVTNQPNTILETLALGSCIAVILAVRDRHIIGLAHVALPDSSVNRKLAASKPGSFADTAIPTLLKEIHDLEGEEKKANGLEVYLVGGASVLDGHEIFDIGARNARIIKEKLDEHNLHVNSMDIGGRISRNVHIEVSSFTITITSPGRGGWTL